MPPYAPDSSPHHGTRRYSTESVAPQLKRHLSLIPERFVRFADTIHVLPFEKCEETTEIWYTKQELSQFKRECRKVIRQHRGAPPRGLEQRTTAGFQRALKNRLSALAVVLQIQYVRHDPVCIANAYEEVTRHCQLEAIDVAIRDHVEATFDAANPYHGDGEDTPECLACFPLSPQWLISLLSPPRQNEALLMSSHQQVGPYYY